MNIALLAKGGNMKFICHKIPGRRPQELTPKGACGKYVTHCWHDVMLCQACSLVRWNCLCKAEGFWWYKAWPSWAASIDATVCVSSAKQAQRLCYLSGHYCLQLGQGHYNISTNGSQNKGKGEFAPDYITEKK
jgi:hypothetical protein